MRTLLLSLGVASLVALPAAAAAQPAKPPDTVLEDIRELVFRARYDDAIARAEQFLEREDLTAVQRNGGLEALATAHIANRDEEQAMQVLYRLYRRDPGHRLDDPDASPLVQSAFARVRERRHDPVDVVIQHEPPEVESRESPLLQVRLTEGRDAVHELRVAYRTGDMSSYSRIVMSLERDATATARLPVVGNPRQPQRVDYFIEALAPSLTPLERRGSAEDPLQLTVPPTELETSDAGGGAGPTPAGGGRPGEPVDEGDGVAGAWWLWTIVGAVVVGGAVAGGLLLSGSDPTTGSLGAVTLE